MLLVMMYSETRECQQQQQQHHHQQQHYQQRRNATGGQTHDKCSLLVAILIRAFEDYNVM